MEGHRLAAYRIEREIGRGGQAVVYRAVWVDFGQVVALKVLTPRAGTDHESRARFEREATSVAALEHPHVLPVFQSGEVNGRCFIAMKFVAGGGLAERIRRDGALAVPTALDLLRQLASAVDHAHENGIVHRDIKPANVLLGGSGHAYLADFGLARHAQAPALTPVGAWIGTPEYTAPEVLRGETPGPPSDRYAFALLAYEVLTGRVAFPRSTPAAIIYSHLNDAPPRAIDVRPALGKKVSSELARGMDKRPDRRPSSSSELVERITTAIDATPGALEAFAPAKVEVSPERFMSTRLAPRLVPTADSRKPRRSERLRPRRVAIVGLAAVAIAGLALGVRGIGGPAPGGPLPGGEAPIAAAGVAPAEPAQVAVADRERSRDEEGASGGDGRADDRGDARPPRGQPGDERPGSGRPPRGRRV